MIKGVFFDAVRIASQPPFLVREGERKGWMRRYADNVGLVLADGRPCEEYNAFGADRKGVCAGDFVRFPEDMFRRIADRNRQADPVAFEVLENKRLFAHRMREAGVRHVPTLAEVTSEGVLLLEGAPVGRETAMAYLRERGADFFIKKVSLWGGQGIVRVTVAADGFCAEGRPYDLAAAFAEGESVVQPAVRQVAELAALNASSINTLRIVTCRRDDGFELLLPSVVRIGRMGMTADNIGSGGIAVGVEADGRLKPWGFTQTERDETMRYEAHPDHGYSFSDKRISGYAAACELALAAHRAVPKMLAVGWDVAIAPDGPTLIEGNAMFGIDLNEIAHQLPAARRLKEADGI